MCIGGPFPATAPVALSTCSSASPKPPKCATLLITFLSLFSYPTVASLLMDASEWPMDTHWKNLVPEAGHGLAIGAHVLRMRADDTLEAQRPALALPATESANTSTHVYCCHAICSTIVREIPDLAAVVALAVLLLLGFALPLGATITRVKSTSPTSLLGAWPPSCASAMAAIVMAERSMGIGFLCTVYTSCPETEIVVCRLRQLTPQNFPTIES